MINERSSHRLKFHLFMSSNDPHIPAMDSGLKSNFVDLPRGVYNKAAYAQDQMKRYLKTMAAGEELGFDGLMLMEQRAPGFMPNVMITSAALAERTSRVQIIAAGPVINSYQGPLQAAEAIATLDVVANGRLGVGFPLGIGTAYHATNANPSEARARFVEGLAFIDKALAEDEPFEWRGDYYHYPIVNLWPTPLHTPERWLPAAGSRETIELAARGKYTYMAILNPRASMIRNLNLFKEIAETEYGYTPEPQQSAAVVHIYVAETDEQARREAEPHLAWMNQSVMRSAFHDFFPPGYTSPESLRAMLSSGYRSKSPSEFSFDELVEEGMALVGSPKTVREALEKLVNDLGTGQIVVMADAGSMPEWMSTKSMTLFAREVMPYFRDAGGRPSWEVERPVGYTTQSEFGATRPPYPIDAETRIHGFGYVNVETAHIDALRVKLRDE
ncbi:MAG TPA: LLM class flavin-dependent oxidoreductase [Pseudolysinimonas sp.]|nr:LLM class flavin-dependent oxidoreductase [Pseudolysinimonas sp.]